MDSLLHERNIYEDLKSKVSSLNFLFILLSLKKYDDMLHEVRDARSQKGIIEKEYEKFYIILTSPNIFSH